ncbi:hypothetical protein FA95DRAFT_1567012 [Auriscalpium vulgare]|uniref:Uncharacterized protein n=1 Tax=Auriscalpium vulgare TaxID=40419 RepID=A0ACB8R6L7_9AGAM|nr:hypothetical protein FA95DRAFT_1567012 [Auriscalpium vulgare]
MLSLRATLGAYVYCMVAKKAFERTVAEIMAEIVPGMTCHMHSLAIDSDEIGHRSPDKPLPDAQEMEKRRNFWDHNAKFVQALKNSAPEHDDDGDDEEVPPVENLKTLIDILEAESCTNC